jgi:hypothetical protein
MNRKKATNIKEDINAKLELFTLETNLWKNVQIYIMFEICNPGNPNVCRSGMSEVSKVKWVNEQIC